METINDLDYICKTKGVTITKKFDPVYFNSQERAIYKPDYTLYKTPIHFYYAMSCVRQSDKELINKAGDYVTIQAVFKSVRHKVFRDTIDIIQLLKKISNLHSD